MLEQEAQAQRRDAAEAVEAEAHAIRQAAYVEADRERTAALRAESVRAALGLAHGDASEIVAAANVGRGHHRRPFGAAKAAAVRARGDPRHQKRLIWGSAATAASAAASTAVPASFAAEQGQAERRDLLAANQIIAAQREKEEAQRIRREALQKERAAAQRCGSTRRSWRVAEEPTRSLSDRGSPLSFVLL